MTPLTVILHFTLRSYKLARYRSCIVSRSFRSDTLRVESSEISGAGTFFEQGGLKIVRSCQRLGGEAPQTPLFSNARFYEQDTQQTYFDRHQLHARSSDRNFFRIIFYRGKQDCLPLGFSNHARITTHVFVKCKYLNHKTKK